VLAAAPAVPVASVAAFAPVATVLADGLAAPVDAAAPWVVAAPAWADGDEAGAQVLDTALDA